MDFEERFFYSKNERKLIKSETVKNKNNEKLYQKRLNLSKMIIFKNAGNALKSKVKNEKKMKPNKKNNSSKR